MLTPRLLLGYFFSQPCHLLTLWDSARINVHAVNSAAGNAWAYRSNPFLTYILQYTSPLPHPWKMIKGIWHHGEINTGINEMSMY